MRLALAALTLACACAGPRSSIEVAPGQVVSAERYRRLAVAAFDDRRGEGRLVAAKVALALAHLDYSCVDPAQVDAVLSDLRRDPGEELTPEQLARIKKLTLADALLLGEISTSRRSAGIALLDAANGDVVLRARVRPAGDVFESADEIADAVARVFSERRERKRPSAAESVDALPDPQ